MTAVDLRSQYEKTYNQGSDNACGPFAVSSALDCIYEHAMDSPARFDPYHLWEWVRFHRGMAGTNTGSTFDSLEKATRLNGMKLATDVLTGFELVRTQVADASYSELKHLLRMGVPVVWEMKVTPDVYALSGQRDWRTHQIGRDTSQAVGQHYVCIVGYDDAAQRWLVENSWGSDWADGGFFGVPYASFQSLTESLQHFNQLPINPKKTEGYTVPAFMTTAERAAFTERAKPQILKLLMDAFATDGPQALINRAIEWGVSDKHIEVLAGWERGTIRAFKDEHKSLNWDGFVWDQL